jgi:hypothetical protein
MNRFGEVDETLDAEEKRRVREQRFQGVTLLFHELKWCSPTRKKSRRHDSHKSIHASYKLVVSSVATKLNEMLCLKCMRVKIRGHGTSQNNAHRLSLGNLEQ